MGNYQKGLTNMATTETEFEADEIGIKMPSIVFCMAPTMKPEVLEKFNISNDFFMMLDGKFEHMIGKKSMEEIILESSYRLNVDFQIIINRNPPQIYGHTNFNLNLGTNIFQMDETDYTINITEVYSIQQGLCYIFNSDLYLSIPKNQFYVLSIKVNEDNPNQKMKVTFASEKDINGILMSLWETKPLIVPEVTFNTRTTIIDLHETISRKISNCNPNGEPSHQCLATHIDQLIQSSKCSRKCKPMIVKSYIDTYKNKIEPTNCYDLKDEKCIFDEAQEQFTTILSQCKGQCHNQEYSGKISETGLVQTSFPNDTRKRIDLFILSLGSSRTIVQEYKIYDEVGLIGSIGGSLGLFLGVSFYGVISDVLDHFWKKIAKQD